jgi:hypothetical protein
MFDYLHAFPIPVDLLPHRLRSLLEPVGLDSGLRVEVCSQFELDPHGHERECIQMAMAVVPDDGKELPLPVEWNHGVVAYSVPDSDTKGASENFCPSLDGHDYVVASWGSGSFYTFNLAEKVWMALGLTPRCIGNEEQRIVYDDLRLPEFNVAGGEVSGQYYWQPSRNISWVMSNEYLRRYLWMRGAIGVRTFFYERLMPDTRELRDLMEGEPHVELKGEGDWFLLDIREHRGGLLIQLWATMHAITCELCENQTANGILWPGIDDPVTHDRANSIFNRDSVYLDDRFLEKYEQNSFYDSTPVKVHGEAWHCSPSYLGQWSFPGCRRVGRNLIRVSLRDLYQAKPEREILHAHVHAVSPARIAQTDFTEEHIVSKTERLVAELLQLGDHLSELGASLGIGKAASDLINLSRQDIVDNGWLNYPQLRRLAQVAPLEMSQQAFLSRCKSIHEIWQCIPPGFLKRLLEAAGVPRDAITQWGSLKLFQTLLNILEGLDRNEEQVDAYRNRETPQNWDARDPSISPLFVCNELRIADAHDVGERLEQLQQLGFDTASLRHGYGLALDFVFDRVIEAFAAINRPFASIFRRTIS